MKQTVFGMKNWIHRPIVRQGIGVAAIFTAGVSSLFAHPGHALGQEGVAHVVTSPYHLAMLAAAGLTLAVSARLVQRGWSRRILQWSGGAAVLAAAVLWGHGM